MNIHGTACGVEPSSADPDRGLGIGMSELGLCFELTKGAFTPSQLRSHPLRIAAGPPNRCPRSRIVNIPPGFSSALIPTTCIRPYLNLILARGVDVGCPHSRHLTHSKVTVRKSVLCFRDVGVRSRDRLRNFVAWLYSRMASVGFFIFIIAKPIFSSITAKSASIAVPSKCKTRGCQISKALL